MDDQCYAHTLLCRQVVGLVISFGPFVLGFRVHRFDFAVSLQSVGASRPHPRQPLVKLMRNYNFSTTKA